MGQFGHSLQENAGFTVDAVSANEGDKRRCGKPRALVECTSELAGFDVQVARPDQPMLVAPLLGHLVELQACCREFSALDQIFSLQDLLQRQIMLPQWNGNRANPSLVAFDLRLGFVDPTLIEELVRKVIACQTLASEVATLAKIAGRRSQV
ncbi:MAG TPA: hypothetical protein VKY89_11210 [Thermoanaerobaculia bacterium]|nr:hypothetical protein [Thermoanaerobaculia bacterium]